MKTFGPTGKFPEGKIHPSDEGELQFGVGADHNHRQVVIQFGSPVSWLTLPPETAVKFAKSILAKVDELGG